MSHSFITLCEERKLLVRKNVFLKKTSPTSQLWYVLLEATQLQQLEVLHSFFYSKSSFLQDTPFSLTSSKGLSRAFTAYIFRLHDSRKFPEYILNDFPNFLTSISWDEKHFHCSFFRFILLDFLIHPSAPDSSFELFSPQNYLQTGLLFQRSPLIGWANHLRQHFTTAIAPRVIKQRRCSRKLLAPVSSQPE